MENREFYYDFWFEEATDLVTKHDIQMKLCGKFCRACQGNLESQLTFEVIINNVPTVEDIIQQVGERFPDQHLKALTLRHGSSPAQHVRGALCQHV